MRVESYLEYILGTVQLGLDYGINNIIGKPPKEEAFAILSCAYENGIRLLDTASGYGDSERLIGEFIRETGKDFVICSKYSGKAPVADELQATLRALSTDTVYLYYLHRYEDCLDGTVISSLLNFREKGLVERIGISIYAPEELCNIAQNLNNIIDVVQIPFSIMDCSRWIEPINYASDNGIDVLCRSVFLQGAIFKPIDDKFIEAYNIQEQLAFVHDLCIKYGTDIATLAFSFCNHIKEISGILFGAETLAQLKQNLTSIDNLVEIELRDTTLIIDKMKNINPEFIDPRTWPQRNLDE